MSRPSKEHYFMSLALLAAQRASCPRRKVGCVLVDKNSFVVSTGYNGPPSGDPNCTDTPCGGQNQPSGQGLNLCKAIHAEINAYNQAGDRLLTVTDMFLTAGPCCPLCTAATVGLIKTGKLSNLKKIYFFDRYPSDTAKTFEDLGIELIHVDQKLDTNGFLFNLAVTLGFRKRYEPMNRVLCVGGPLHGHVVQYSSDCQFMRVNLSECKPDFLNQAMKFDSYIRDRGGCIGATVDKADYYLMNYQISFKSFKVFKFCDMSDQLADQYIQGLLIENPQLRNM